MECETAFAQIGQLIGQLRGSDTVPNGTRRAISAAVDELRYAGAPQERLVVAGDVAATIHKWELARCFQDNGKQEAARARLEAIGERWFGVEHSDA